MKNRFYYLFLLFIPIAGFTQQIDTTTIYLQIDSLLLVAEDFKSKEQFQEMHDMAESAAAIAIKNLGPTDSKYANSLHLQAVALRSLKQYEEAKELVDKVLRIYDKNGETDSADYAASLHLKGLIYYYMRNYVQAEPILIEANSLLGKVLGKEHPDYAESLGDMALLYYRMGQYDQAEQLYIVAKSIREKVLGKEHPQYATSIINLATTYKAMGFYEKAEQQFIEVVSLYAKIKGKDHHDYANSLNSLGVLYVNIGHYNKAEPLYLEAKAVQEKALGKEHHEYATTLNNLGSLYSKEGNYEKAEAFIIEAKAIREKELGKGNSRYAISLHALATLYQNMGNYEKAEPLMIEANTIMGKRLGKEHSKYASSLNNLAVLHHRMGHYEKAEKGHIEAKTIREKELGKSHPNFAISLSNLADLYVKIGQYKKAESHYLEAISIEEKALGKEHPSYTTSLKGLATLYFAKKEYGMASAYFNSANNIDKTLLERAADHLSSVELQKYLLKFEKDAARFASFVHQSKSATLSEESYNNSLFYKGFLLGNAMRIEQAAVNAPDSIQEQYGQWKSYRIRLSKEYSKSIAARKNVPEMEEKANRLEKGLLKSVPALKEARSQVTWKEVRDQLKEGEAAIEFSHFQYYSPEATDSIFYTALVLRPGDKSPQPIFLFEEKELNKLLETKGDRSADYANALYGLSDRGAVVLENKDKKTLYDLIWQPLKAALTDVKTIYYAPSGLLHRINLSAIPIDDEENLASQHELVRINSTRSLVIPSSLSTENNGVVLYGGLQYDNTKDVAVQTETRGGFWHFLKGTEREVHKLEKILQENGLETILHTDTAGTEESFKKYGLSTQASPRILHIATHGYFYPDPKITKAGEKNGQEPIFKISEQPMLRSGLILAGGNQYWENEKQRLEQEDGVLTALEISQMDLRQTELVVLSACETGLGDIQGNEGVYGLQRAFKIAGAKYIIMSLWQVPDKQTSSLMQHFYANWLEEKMPIREAFASAQRDLSEMGDPFHWAGFVLVE